MRNPLRHKRSAGLAFDILNCSFMVVFSLLIIYPFWNLFLQSFSDVSAVTSLGMHLWIDQWHIGAYRYVFTGTNIYVAYYNTLFRTSIGTVLSLVVVLMASYPLSKKDLPGRNVITGYFLITMFFSGGLIPFYLLVRQIGLIDNRFALILPSLLNVFYVIIARNFLMTIDSALEESAFIDGASYVTVLIKIVIPLSKPVIATIALWTAVSHWNAWFDALIFIRSESKVVLQLLLRRLLMNEQSMELMGLFDDRSPPIPPESVKAVITLITIGPIILLYPFIQKYFIKGIMLGSLKG